MIAGAFFHFLILLFSGNYWLNFHSKGTFEMVHNHKHTHSCTMKCFLRQCGWIYISFESFLKKLFISISYKKTFFLYIFFFGALLIWKKFSVLMVRNVRNIWMTSDLSCQRTIIVRYPLCSISLYFYSIFFAFCFRFIIRFTVIRSTYIFSSLFFYTPISLFLYRLFFFVFGFYLMRSEYRLSLVRIYILIHRIQKNWWR